MGSETFRPTISVIRVTPDRSGVEVVLERDGRQATGYEAMVDDDVIRTASLATITAARGLLLAEVRLEVAWVEQLEPSASPLPVVIAAVTLQVEEGRQEQLLGAAYVHSEPAIAAVRASLDGLTRRLAHL